MDVQPSADGIPVVIHDARVNRTTNGSGVVSHLTLGELHSLDAGGWFDRRLARRPRSRAADARVDDVDRLPVFSGELVPSLKDVLTLLAPAMLKRIYVEIKGAASNREALLERVLSLIRELRMQDSITLLSFDHAIVRRAKEIAGDVRTAATFPARGRRLISTRSIIRDAGNAWVDEVALHAGLATRRAVDALHQSGLGVSVWTVNNRVSMRRVCACGVDAIMTNFPDRLREVLDARAAQPDAADSRVKR